MTSDLANLDFPKTREEVEERFTLYSGRDPFPGIPPALLNSADIYDYIRVTGMLWPFESTEQQLEKKLKSGSYEIDFAGDLHYCDELGRYRVTRIAHSEEFILPKNSIVYLWLETQFRLPDYIALRFNLKITHVHAGLLLGTGPLIDPGFVGRLLIPLHNLTAEDYTLCGGDGLIWVEFTKLSPNVRWFNEYPQVKGTRGAYRPFPKVKKDLTPQDYFVKARKSAAPRSSIPGEFEEAKKKADQAEAAAAQAKKDAESAAEEAKSAKTWITWGAIGSIIALLVSIAFGLFQVASLVQDANQYVLAARDEANTTKKEMSRAIDSLNLRLIGLEKAFRDREDTKQQPK
jgi:deoxycytidine triphosphate deaminase